MTMTNGTSSVLIADRDTRSVRFMSRSLETAGFHVDQAHDAEDAILRESSGSHCVVLVDDQLPDSIATVRTIRESSTVPIVFTMLAGEDHAARALEVGADAVLTKPFSPELLVAQVFAFVRRYRLERSQLTDRTYLSGELTIDLMRRTVSLAGIHVHLSVREYRLLEVLAVNCGRILTHEQLLSLVWGPGYEGNSDLLRCYVHKVRKRIGDDANDAQFIQTENQIGYWMDRPQVA